MLSNLNSLARGLALVLAVAALAGCATSKEKLLTHGDRTMMDIWQQEAGDGGGAAGRNAGDVDLGGLQFEAVGLDAGQVQDVVEQRHQVVARVADDRDVFLLGRIQTR